MRKIEIRKLEEEIKSYEKAIEIDPKDKHAWNDMGYVYDEIGKHKKAIESYEKAIEIDPKYVTAWYNVGVAYQKIKNYEIAIKSYEKAIEINPKKIGAWFNMGVAYQKIKNHEKAIKSYKKTIEIDPNFGEAWYNMGYAYDEIGMYEKAIESYEKAIEIDPKYVKAWINMGIDYVEIEKYKKAIESYEKAIEIDPKYGDARHNIGNAYRKMGKHEKAIESYEKAIELNPKKINAWFNMGIAYKKIKKHKKAIKSYEKAIEINPQKIGAWSNMGYSYDKIGKYEKAIEAYEKAIEIDPKYVYAWVNMGNAYSKIKNYQKAIKSYKKVIEIEPNKLYAWVYMGIAYSKIKNYEKAIESFEKVVEIDPKNTKAWDYLALNYKKIGNNEKAIESKEKTYEIHSIRMSANINTKKATGNTITLEKPNNDEIEDDKKTIFTERREELKLQIKQLKKELGITTDSLSLKLQKKQLKKELGITTDSLSLKLQIKQLKKELGLPTDIAQEKPKVLVEVKPNNKDDIEDEIEENIEVDIEDDIEDDIESDKKTILTEKFRFIRDDVFLCPEVNTETGRQQVIIQKIDSKTGKIEFERRIYCIHVCVASITPDEHKRYYTDPEFHEKFDEISLNIRSSANLKEIDLNPEEKFVALKSWAEGISEAGMDAFMVQNNIDLASGITAPLTGTLMRFMLKVDSIFLQDYIAYVERTCSVDGVIHKTSFVANFLSLLEDIRNQNCIWDEYPSMDTIISSILDPDPSPLIFKGHMELLFLRDLIEPGFLNQFLDRIRKVQNSKEFSMTLKKYVDQIMDKFNSDYNMDLEYLSLTKFEREVLLLGMRENSNSIRREISKSYLETTCLLEFLIYDDDYSDNNNFEILAELIKSAPNEMIPFQEITEKVIDEYYKEYSHISKILSDPRIKEPITALLNKNPPISIFLKEPYLLFFNAVYNNDNLHDIFKKLISSPDKEQVRKLFNEILKVMRFQCDEEYYTLNYYFNKEYAIYFVNLLDELSKTDFSSKVNDIRFFFIEGSVKQKMIDLGKKFGIELRKNRVWSDVNALSLFYNTLKDSLNFDKIKKIYLTQSKALCLEWENKSYLVSIEDYCFDAAKEFGIGSSDYISFYEHGMHTFYGYIELYPPRIYTITKLGNKLVQLKITGGNIQKEEFITLIRSDFEVIRELETLIGKKIPPLPSIIEPYSPYNEKNKFGFITENNRIIHLVLFNQKLTCIPENIGSLRALRVLSLDVNLLESLPESIGSLQALETLHLCRNSLTSLPESFSSLQALKILHLGRNKLESLPESIGSLHSLEKVIFDFNKISILPDSFGLLKNLKELRLGHNRIKFLPNIILSIRSLEILHIEGNKLTSLPESIISLQSLINLLLQNNMLDSLPESIISLQSLKFLDLRGNPITSEPISKNNILTHLKNSGCRIWGFLKLRDKSVLKKKRKF